MLQDLVGALRERRPLGRTRSDMARVLKEAGARWRPEGALVSRLGHYTRTCAYQDDLMEVLLLNWAPGATSSIHDHGNQHCWMLVLEGALRVDDYERLDCADIPGYARIAARGSRVLDAGGVDVRSEQFDLHRVTASGVAPAVSLHVYSGPLRRFLVYDEAAERCEPAMGKYDDVLPIFANLAQR